MRSLLKGLETGSRKLLFRFISSAARRNVHQTVPIGEELRRILIMRQDRIGDMVMTLPLLRKLKEIHRKARIGVVASRSNSVVLKYEEDVEVLPFQKDPAGFLRSIVRAAEFRPDAAVDMHMHDSTTSYVFCLLSGALWKLHVDRENRLPFNVRVTANQDGHIMTTFADLLSGLGKELKTENLDSEPFLSETELDFAGGFWKRTGLSPGNCAIVNISAGGDNRRWPVKRYVAVCQGLAKMNLVPVIVSSPGDREKAHTAAEGENSTVVAPLTPDILHLAALLRGTGLLVSPDTSVVHIAAACGVPVVGMYLPFDSSLPKWYPWRVDCEVVMADDSHSLDSVNPQDVIESASRILGRMR
ncbi:MAG: hypothetical protein GF388_10470 [Candidatus Aegiribacteria sp.]|nr:hypothetical protein [Candidatus Aegiribacteria sp.]MBD3295447.1 hypothetical protein [Candidatus Fermentibacteria bacterium]